MTKVLLMTSNELRHRYAAGVLASCFDVCGIVSEAKKALAEYLPKLAEDEIIHQHFLQRSVAEKMLLGEMRHFPKSTDVLLADHGNSNSLEVFEWVKARKPDVVLLYGSSIIKPPLLSYYEDRMINLHLGLSPYYRGSGTNFWPLVDGLPECVGATIHLATLKVDGGDILAQVRPENLIAEDGAQELGTKTLMDGLKKMCETIPGYLENRIKPTRQNENLGKLCRRKDLTQDAVTKMRENFDRGMIRDYLAKKQERDAKYPIVS